MDRLRPSKPHIEYVKGLGWLVHAAFDTQGRDRRLQAASHFCMWLNRQEAFSYERMYYYRQLFYNERAAK